VLGGFAHQIGSVTASRQQFHLSRINLNLLLFFRGLGFLGFFFRVDLNLLLFFRGLGFLGFFFRVDLNLRPVFLGLGFFFRVDLNNLRPFFLGLGVLFRVDLGKLLFVLDKFSLASKFS